MIHPKELFLIRDKGLSRALDYFTQAEVLFRQREHDGGLNSPGASLIGRVAFKVYNFLSPFLEEEEAEPEKEMY
jgi:hypothetical protein